MESNVDQHLRDFVANEVLFASEAAKLLGVTTQRLNQLVNLGKVNPVRRSNIGNLYLKADLEARLNELSRVPNTEDTDTVSRLSIVNTKAVVQEAINYFALQSLHQYSDKKTEPVFKHLEQEFDLTKPLLSYLKEASVETGHDESVMRDAYIVAKKGFEQLKETDYIVKRGDNIYPELLAKWEEAPRFLFMRGKINLLRYPIVSVVGSRQASETGCVKAYKLAQLLGRNRVVVASGLAKGIDASAHKGAIDFNKPTIGVIGTPLTKYYPKENKHIQEQLEKEHLVISQFPPSANVQRWHFPMRNAIMSGISLGTIIVEAGETSGALKQADYALKQQRVLFIPKSALTNEALKWPTKYIKRHGAYSFEKIDELMEKLEEANVILKKSSEEEQLDLFVDKAGGQNVN